MIEWFSKTAETVDELLAKFGEVALSGDTVGLDDLHTRIDALLKNADKRIVVLVDDIDRLDKVETHTLIRSGHTHLGIQTATFAHDRWWFGCYGDPEVLLVTDAAFSLLGRYEFDCSLGIEAWPEGRLLSASGRCEKDPGCRGCARLAIPDEGAGLLYLRNGADAPR